VANRLKEDLVEAGKIGREPERRVEQYDHLEPERGVNRLACTEANRKLRDYAVMRMKEAGLEVKIDKIGNIFARKEGIKTSTGSIMCGSHLDSVPNGGQFDGCLGVFGAIEAIRRMTEDSFDNERPVEVVVFTGEEGPAFGMSLLGSSALVGKINMAEALGKNNTAGQTLDEALREINYKGDFTRTLEDVEYMVELHIEQGPVLHKENIPIGIVENIAGITWLMVTIKGEGNHAGTTPMKMRKDALVTASEIVSFVNRRANEIVDKLGSVTVGTVGKLNVFPNGTNSIPAKVEMGIDIRDVVKENMDSLKSEVVKFINGLGGKYGVDAEIQMPPLHFPTPLSAEVVNIIEQSAKQVGIQTKRMNSGAGHDSQNMAEKVKTGMIFVPSVNGISHSPMEWTEWEDIETGVHVLTQTLKNLSKT